MPRYINEDEFVAWVKEHWCSDCQNDNGLRCRACWIDDAIDIVEEAPTADVVPRSEVERLEQEKDALIKNYTECMREYAREIFEEIEEARERWEAIYSPDHFGYGGSAYGYLETDVDHTIAELKKKYTEEKK